MNINITLLAVSLTLIVVGIGLLIYVGYVSGFVGFMGVAHWAGLGILIVAGILTWVAMVWIVNEKNEFKPNADQYVSLGLSIGISILWWGRYVYTVAKREKD